MSAPLRVYFACEPWDLVDEGIDEVLDRLVGEVGIDGVRVSAVTGPVHLFRPHADVSPRTVRLEAAAHFHPEPRCYADSRLRPVTAAWIKSRNPLEQIARACQKRSLRLRLWVVACDNPTMVERYRFAACKDVFGDPSSTRMCPSNPDVRAYLAGMMEDLTTNYSSESIDLVEADFGRPQDFHRGRANPFDAAAWQQTVMCFCESCRQTATAADIDVDAITAAIAGDPSAAPDEPMHLGRYRELQTMAVTRLITGARANARIEYWVEILDMDSHRALATSQLLPTISGFVLRGGSESVATQDAPHARAAGSFTPPAERAEYLGPTGHTGLVYRVGVDRAISGGAAALVKQVSDDARSGFRTLIFDAYGITPDDRFDWVRQAVRFARRVAGH